MEPGPGDNAAMDMALTKLDEAQRAFAEVQQLLAERRVDLYEAICTARTMKVPVDVIAEHVHMTRQWVWAVIRGKTSR